MTAVHLPPAWLQAVGLPQAWRGHDAWRVLDTALGDGERLAQLWQAWAGDPHACRLLHVVVFAPTPAAASSGLAALARRPDARELGQALQEQAFGLLPGTHRLVAHGGRLQLTVCIGPTLDQLREQHACADTIAIGPPTGTLSADGDATDQAPWDRWALKALARLCRRGSTLAVLPGTGLDNTQLPPSGWAAHDAAQGPGPSPVLWSGQYQPAWQIKTTRQRWPRTPLPASHCVVVGAGLAGAAVAGALALRGWKVTVLDAASEPAAGASGLPVGLFAPQLARDDGPRARLSRAGVRATLQVAQRLLTRGRDWDPCGIARLGASADDLPRDWPPQARPWATAAGDVHEPAALRAALARLARPDQALWQAAAGWIKPRQLVRAWLDHPAVRFQGGCAVEAIGIAGGQWQLFGRDAQLLAQAPQLVIAAAGGSPALLQQALAAARQPAPATALPLSPVDGQVSWARHRPLDEACFPRFPVNGAGSVVAHVPWHGGTAWFAGATYEAPTGAAASVAQSHAHNLARLARLLPEAANRVAPASAGDGADAAVQAWRGTRWTLPDRLPVAGAWQLAGAGPGLWLSTAMGSRGLTYAALCGELIAAQLGAEPLPIDAGLHRSIDVRRTGTGAGPDAAPRR